MKCLNVRATRQHKVLGLIALGFLSGFFQTNVFAAGTPSGTNVDNKATLNYSVGGVPQTLIESAPTGNSTPGVGGGVATSFVVDNKINLTVTEVSGSATSTVPGKTAAVTQFTVTNNGNTTQNFLLSTTQMTGSTLFTKTDNYDVSGCAIHPDANNNGLDDDPASTTIANLAADATRNVWVYCDTAITQVNNDYSIVALTAEAREAGTGAALTNASVNTAGVDVVFADAAGTNDVVLDAKHSAQDAYLVVSPTLTVSKVVSVICDPINGNSNPKNIPGAIEQYAITITNMGSAAAILSTVTDTLASVINFETKLISGAGTPPATTCTSAGGTSLSATGFGAVTGIAPSSYLAPGISGQNVTAGAAISGQNITIDYVSLAVAGTPVLASGSLPAGHFVTVYFNAIIQ